ncbi:CBS domain-containing protein CBSCBSPB3 [Selaginella moellendorffii]|uniref:CBS domain-containing protein CBSCBSPB3 n=1 Tax=Selaginella moellendorffii TaxID=88036 RepID=UPI000D1C799E|nr:CBS domain-containing protein CBSCBSPB3 [Selaginella moellendorffii]|eukprot:XP_024531406.1 CBS domain-containing protein CBSCBSPB3 [Selaginella moellendorffii]
MSTAVHGTNKNPPKRGPSLSRKKTPPENGGSALQKSRSGSGGMISSGGTAERTVKKLRLSKALTVPDGTSVADACKRMANRRVDAALLTNSSALLCGIITDKDVATRVIAEGLRPEDTPVSKVMTRNPTFVMSDSLAVDALQKMVQGKFRHLPVVDNGEVIALLDITKCLYDAIVRMERSALKGNAIAAAVEDVERQWGNTFSGQSNFVETLKERMFRPTLGTLVNENTKVATVAPGDSVFTATKKMRELKVNSVVVTVGNKPVGILTSKDVLMRVVAVGVAADIPVEKIMTTNPECANLEMTIVDALHTMHDGKFLHLPVINKDGHVVSCVDVLHITHSAFATVGSTPGLGDGGMMQKFWDSAFGLEQSTEDDDDSRSDVSARLHLHAEGGKGSANTFSFKLEDKKGRVHRFQCGSETLVDLVAAIKNRVGIDVPQILYEDDEGDRVLLATDSDLVDALRFAKVSGSKGLRLFLDESTESPTAVTKKKTPRPAGRVPSSFDFAFKESWPASTTTATIAAGAAMVVGFSLLAYLRRSNP